MLNETFIIHLWFWQIGKDLKKNVFVFFVPMNLLHCRAWLDYIIEETKPVFQNQMFRKHHRNGITATPSEEEDLGEMKIFQKN